MKRNTKWLLGIAALLAWQHHQKQKASVVNPRGLGQRPALNPAPATVPVPDLPEPIPVPVGEQR